MDVKKAFEILGIQRNSNKKQIKDAYLKKASQLHPDRRNADKDLAEEEFKDLGQAYCAALDDTEPIIHGQSTVADPVNRSGRPRENFSRPRTRLGIFNQDLMDQFFKDPLSIFDLIERRIQSSFRTTTTRGASGCPDHDSYTICLKCHQK